MRLFSELYIHLHLHLHLCTHIQFSQQGLSKSQIFCGIHRIPNEFQILFFKTENWFFPIDFQWNILWILHPLKLLSAIVYRIFIYHQMIAFQKKKKKKRKIFFISSKNLFFRCRDIHVFIFSSSPLFFPVSIALVTDLRKILKVYDAINCISKNLLTHFVWYLKKEIGCDIEILAILRVSNKEHFYGKIIQEMCTKS